MPPGRPVGATTAEPRWSSRSVGNRFQHATFYLLIRLGGKRAAYPLLYAVTLYYLLFRPAIRRRTAPYLSRRFPDASPWRRFGLAYRWTVEFGKILIDRAAAGVSGFDRASTTLVGREVLQGLLDEGHGVLLLTAHVGCWQVVMAALSFIRVPVHLLLQRDEGDVDLHYFEHRGVPCPFTIIDPRGFLGGTVEMLQALKRGEVVSAMGDRVFGSNRNSVVVDFLGGPVRFPFSPFKVASAAGAPIVVLHSCKTGPSSYRLEVARVIRVPDGLHTSPAEFQPFVAQFVQALEEYVRAQPFQFFNFFDMWDTVGPDEPAVPAEPVRSTPP